jgi:hypothetical protein
MSLGKRLIETAGEPSIENFNIVTYTGNGSTTGPVVTVGFKPDMIFIKRRDSADAWYVYDSTRSTSNPRTKILLLNGDNAELDNTAYYSVDFLSDGFQPKSSLSTATNASGGEYVAYCFKANGGTTSTDSNGTVNSTVQANTNLGFSIATTTNNSGSNQTFGHGLGTTPEWIIRKKTSAALNWTNYFTVLDGSLDYMNFNTTTAKDNSGYPLPTSTVFTVPTNGTWIFYSFVSISGKTKFGTYTSNATTKINTGFQPDFFIFKYLGSGDWYVQDKTQSESVTGIHGGDLIKKYYVINSSAAENSVSTGGVEIMSDGFYPTNWFDTTNGVFYWAMKIF